MKKKLHAISGPGINMDLVGGYKTWVMRASSEREAWFMVFSLGTEFFKDVMAAERLAPTLTEEVLGFEDSFSWDIGEAIGNCVIEVVYTKSALKR